MPLLRGNSPDRAAGGVLLGSGDHCLPAGVHLVGTPLCPWAVGSRSSPPPLCHRTHGDLHSLLSQWHPQTAVLGGQWFSSGLLRGAAALNLPHPSRADRAGGVPPADPHPHQPLQSPRIQHLDRAGTLPTLSGCHPRPRKYSSLTQSSSSASTP